MPDTDAQAAKSEFPRPFNTERLQDSTRTETITANAGERTALAERMGIVAVDSFTAEITLGRMPDEPRLIEVRGTIRAQVVQSCIVTLDPVRQDVTDEFDTIFASEGYVQRWLREHPHDDLDAPEPLDGGWLDIGELATQYLALALDPYPRCANAENGFELQGMHTEDTEPTEEKQTPFAVLTNLSKLQRER